MLDRDHAKTIRAYLNQGGTIYPGLCRRGSYFVFHLHLERFFEESEVQRGRSS